MKFNIGDRVQSISTKRRGTVVTTSGNLVAVELDDQTSGVRLIKFGISHGLLLEEANLEKIPSNKILITSDGKTTLARLYDGEKVIRTAETKCSPRDTYDFATGANLAYGRLMRPAEPKCYNGAVVCIWSESEFFTVGKVYTYKDGIVNGDEMPAYNSGDPAKTKDDALNRELVHFIEFKGE